MWTLSGRTLCQSSILIPKCLYFSSSQETSHISWIVPALEPQTLRDVLRRVFTSSTLTTHLFWRVGRCQKVRFSFLFHCPFLFLSVSLIYIHRLKAQVGNTSSDNLSWLRFDMDWQGLRVVCQRRVGVSPSLVDRFIGKPLESRPHDGLESSSSYSRTESIRCSGWIHTDCLARYLEMERGESLVHHSCTVWVLSAFSLSFWGKFFDIIDKVLYKSSGHSH